MPTRTPTHKPLPHMARVHAAAAPVKRMTGRRLQARRERAWLDAGAACAHCGRVITLREYELDHIVALHNGGVDEAGNVQVLCKACHADKTDTDLGRKTRVRIGADGWPAGGWEKVRR